MMKNTFDPEAYIFREGKYYTFTFYIYFVAEIKILHLYCKFTTFINGKTTLFIFYINDSYDRHRLDFECQ